MKCRAAVRLAAVLVLAAAPLAACDRGDAEGSDCPATQRANTVSGYCVPRYVSLKHDEVYGRKGPGKDYPAVWVYRARGLPVQIVAETSEWRRVCDPFGGATWIHRSMVAGRRTILALGPGPVNLEKSSKAGAPQVGMMAARALANLDRCENGWCKVKVDGLTGWAPAASFWGVAPAAQCR
ncbi:MAG TPA: SH3 domain-containing protein [Caulobacteraceae bacterium]|jgi:SH3-like domain-containing protein|nr:SH3 domain-containing protein [Caulobacteraceae bacterium]